MLAIMNPDDKAGLRGSTSNQRRRYGAEVTVLTMGLPKADDVLREAMAMGADKANPCNRSECLGGADTWATSTTIAGALRESGLRSDHHRTSGDRW